MTTQLSPSCQNLENTVNSILQLLKQEPALKKQNVTAVQASLKKAISPKFEIVFAGAFSAGKSMLINALLGRELLYSAEGHATGTECYIEYSEADQERVVLTFLSLGEIQEQTIALCQRLQISGNPKIDECEVIKVLGQISEKIIQEEGGEAKSERAKQAKALMLLLEGLEANRERIHPY